MIARAVGCRQQRIDALVDGMLDQPCVRLHPRHCIDADQRLREQDVIEELETGRIDRLCGQCFGARLLARPFLNAVTKLGCPSQSVIKVEQGVVEETACEENVPLDVGDQVKKQELALEITPARPIVRIATNKDARMRLLIKPALDIAPDVICFFRQADASLERFVHVILRQIAIGVERLLGVDLALQVAPNHLQLDACDLQDQRQWMAPVTVLLCGQFTPVMHRPRWLAG